MGGVQFSTLYLIEELRLYENIETHLFLPKEGKFSKLCRKKFIQYSFYHPRAMLSTSISLFYDLIRIPNPIAWIWNIFNILNNSFRIRIIIKKHQNAVILSKGLHSHIVTTIANRKFPNKLIWHLQDLISKRFGNIFLRLINYLAKIGPNQIICDGSSIFNSLSKQNQLKSTIILNGVRSDLFRRDYKYRTFGRKELNIPNNSYVIGHVGRFTPWKGQIKLVEAFINYSKKNSQAILLLIGAPIFDTSLYINKIKNIISKNALEDRIILSGFRSDLDKMFSIMDLFIYPSVEKDTSPLALLSAISSGLPIAASSIESLREIIEKVPTITLFNPLIISEIESIYQKFEDHKLRLESGNSINLEFENHFNISKNTKKMIKIINSA